MVSSAAKVGWGRWLDAVIVRAPVDDALFDGLGSEFLAGGLESKCRKFFVRGEAEGDQLGGSQSSDDGVIGAGQDRDEAELLFEPDDSILGFDGVRACFEGEQDEGEGHDDPPDVQVRMGGPIVNGFVDGEAKVEQQERHQNEVIGGIEACVILVGLRCGHSASFRVVHLEEMAGGGNDTGDF
jgi:hypothetical protein